MYLLEDNRRSYLKGKAGVGRALEDYLDKMKYQLMRLEDQFWGFVE
jgi:hypothetical protein